MAILNIQPVSREGMRFIISLYGLSETGKTYSALLLAAGMEPDPSKRGMIDTEGGQRGRAYVDEIPGGYLYGHLTPPFTPERYAEAISEFEAAGVSVLVIDSASHVWAADGGILDMVENATETNDMAKWKKPKRRLGKMTGRVLQSDMNVILCSRAKQPLVKDDRGKLVPGPVVPIQEKLLRYDMMVMAQMLGDGEFTVTRPEGKCHGPLRKIFAAHKLMNMEMGRQLMAWLGENKTKSPELRALEVTAYEKADGGIAALKVWVEGLTEPQRVSLRPIKDNLQSIARAADRDREEREREERESKPLDDPFGGSKGNAADDPFGGPPKPMKIEDATTGTAAASADTKSAAAPIDDWAQLLTDLKASAAKADTIGKWTVWVESHELDVEQLRDSKRPDLIADWDAFVRTKVEQVKPSSKAAAE